MAEKKPKLNSLVHDIYSTNPSEIYCDKAIDQMAQASHLDLSLQENQQRFGDLLTHLQLCSNCQAEFTLLQQVAAQPPLEEVLRIPPVPNNGRFPITEAIKNLFSIEFPGFAPMLGQALTRGEDLGLEPTAVSLPNSAITLELDVGISENNQQNRDLFLTLFNESNDETLIGEGSSVWLHHDSKGPVIQEQVFDQLGDLHFTNLTPGTYAIRIQVKNQHFSISPIQLP